MNTDSPLQGSRRHFLATSTLATAAVFLRPWRIAAEGESPVTALRGAAASAKITRQELRGNISVLDGSGGNIAVLAGRDGKLLVDAGITASKPQLIEALRSLGSGPVKHLINTHWHFDHTDGNEWLHAMGAEITAHEKTRQHLSKTTRVDAWNFTFPPSPEGARPTNVFQKELDLHFNGEKLVLTYYPPCHTDSDISVAFGNADILHVGDTWWNGYYPFIDYNTGGSIDGMIHATETNLQRVSAETLIIPGHGPVGGKSDLLEYRDMLVMVRDKVAALKNQGQTLSEVIAAKPTGHLDAKWGGFVIDGRAFTTLVYAGV